MPVGCGCISTDLNADEVERLVAGVDALARLLRVGNEWGSYASGVGGRGGARVGGRGGARAAARELAGKAAKQVARKQVILDTNAVVEYRRALQLLAPDETPVITKTIAAELRDIKSRGRIKGIPAIASSLEVIDEVMDINLRIEIRQRLQEKGVKRGIFGDGIIGATAIRLGIPIITGDKELVDVLNALRPGIARLLPPQ